MRGVSKNPWHTVIVDHAQQAYTKEANRAEKGQKGHEEENFHFELPERSSPRQESRHSSGNKKGPNMVPKMVAAGSSSTDVLRTPKTTTRRPKTTWSTPRPRTEPRMRSLVSTAEADDSEVEVDGTPRSRMTYTSSILKSEGNI
ncbi:hypothetical protein CEXT_362191 [Caerostris extrusa]|uniref:Uncharacterized protein n=1 Tax=Caerostris extrusa TaxID=172846 RepID=A0AAV4P571_CAEEX|nr:hypothetical protein CEXT_362191 [Caerostris extrusa]